MDMEDRGQLLDLHTRSPYAWNDWRRNHPDVEPDLAGAPLADADLGKADLVLANLGQSDLRRAKLANCKLAGTRFAGADLTGAELPDWLNKQFESLSTLKGISSNAQKVFIAMLAACLYCWLTIATTTDINLISNRATSSLPIIQTAVPIVGFFFIGPLVLLGAYSYLHFYLQKLWDGLGLLPAVFPDGTLLHRKTDPWLLTDLVLIHSRRLRGKAPFLVNVQIWASVLLTWWIVPLTLLMFWNRYFDREDFWGTLFHSVCCGIAVSSAVFLYRLNFATLWSSRIMTISASWNTSAGRQVEQLQRELRHVSERESAPASAAGSKPAVAGVETKPAAASPPPPVLPVAVPMPPRAKPMEAAPAPPKVARVAPPPAVPAFAASEASPISQVSGHIERSHRKFPRPPLLARRCLRLRQRFQPHPYFPRSLRLHRPARAYANGWAPHCLWKKSWA